MMLIDASQVVEGRVMIRNVVCIIHKYFLKRLCVKRYGTIFSSSVMFCIYDLQADSQYGMSQSDERFHIDPPISCRQESSLLLNNFKLEPLHLHRATSQT